MPRDTDKDIRELNRAYLMNRAASNDRKKGERLNREQAQRDQDRQPVAPRRVSLSEAEAKLRAARDGAESRHALRDYFKARAAEREGGEE